MAEYSTLYEGKNITVYHIDAYRLNGEEDFIALGGEDIIFGEGISIIEWAERITPSLPGSAIWVDISIEGPEERSFTIHRGSL